MNAIKTIFENMPETISVPRDFVHKRGEIIIIIDEDIRDDKKKSLIDFYGILSDFPERAAQGEYEKRDTV